MSLTKKFANIIGYGNALKIYHLFKRPYPKEIIIDICASCNAACPFCPRIYMPKERAKGYMDLELFKFILKEAKKNNINTIRLYSTAEPTLHPQFDEIINLLKKDNFHITVSTNASLLDKHLDSLLKVDILQFSIEGWNKESYEKYRFPLKFEHVYNNIKLFENKRKKTINHPKTSINLLLTKKTDIEAFMKLWGELVDEINIHFMLKATMFENNKFVTKINEALKDEYFEFEKQKKNFVCSYPFNILTIAFDGKIALCCNDFSAELNLGHIKEGIKKVFNSQTLNKIRTQFYTQQLDICKNCSFFDKPLKNDIEYLKKTVSQLDEKYKNKIRLGI